MLNGPTPLRSITHARVAVTVYNAMRISGPVCLHVRHSGIIQQLLNVRAGRSARAQRAYVHKARSWRGFERVQRNRAIAGGKAAKLNEDLQVAFDARGST